MFFSGTNNPKIRLADDVTSWRVGDKIVIATTDFSLDQSEDYEVAPCGDCGPHELRLKGRLSEGKYNTYIYTLNTAYRRVC